MGTTKGYTGQYSDPLTGLDYYIARYYDPVAGVFLSADAKEGNAQGMNPYAYVAQNPETLTDPGGQMYDCPDGCGGGSGENNHNPPPSNPCSYQSCSVTLSQGHGTHRFILNDLKNNPADRLLFLEDFYNQFARGWGNAEISFAQFLYNSKRLLLSPYWKSVDFQLIADQFIAAFDSLNGYNAQNRRVANWLTFMSHPSNNNWWEAHNTSIAAGDQQARAEGLYARESWVEQHFINETVNVIDDIQSVSGNDPTTLLNQLFSPRSSTTGTLSNFFYPQQYNDISDIGSFGKQENVALGGGLILLGPVGGLAGTVVFGLTLL